ncbi:hypothetical protein [Myxococcus sp. CA033]|uniref:hypothetical protein n=1 Tax=Myxococcus sp. CA033 TaxID=2741516 RepID=UPI001C2D0D64|nr:hypothetical protein [Myxococcus sp. CA033]
MQKWASVEGAVLDENGECAVGIYLLPLVDGGVDIDLITAEPVPDAFTEFVLGCLCSAIVSGYRLKQLRMLRDRGHLVANRYAVEVPAEPVWLKTAIRLCAEKQWPGVVVVEHAVTVEPFWSMTVPTPEPRRTTTFFCEAPSQGRSGVLVGVKFPPGTTREWRGSAQAVLCEAVGMWHRVLFRGRKPPHEVFTAPPGEPVLEEGVVTFQGTGGSFAGVKKDTPIAQEFRPINFKDFWDRLHRAAEACRQLGEMLVTETLPPSLRFDFKAAEWPPEKDGRVKFLGGRLLRPEVLMGVEEKQAARYLWVDGKAPVWVNLKVCAVDEHHTYIQVLFNPDRLTNDDTRLMYQQEGYPPFSTRGPPGGAPDRKVSLPPRKPIKRSTHD